MARLNRDDSASEDEFTILIKETKAKRTLKPSGAPEKPIRRLKAKSSPWKASATGSGSTPSSINRRRKIGVMKDNPLMKRWNSKEGHTFGIDDLSDEAPTKTPSRSKARKAELLKALANHKNSKTEVVGSSNDDSDSFEDSEKEFHQNAIADAPIRRQPRRAAAIKKTIVESSDEEDFELEEVCEKEIEDDDREIEVDHSQTHERESVEKPLSPNPYCLNHDISITSHGTNMVTQSSSQGFSDEEDFDRQLQEQLEEEMSLMADRKQREQKPSDETISGSSSSSSSSEIFIDAIETLEEETVGDKERARNISSAFLKTGVIISEEPATPTRGQLPLTANSRTDLYNKNSENNENDYDDNYEEENSDTEDEDEDSEFVEASASEPEEETVPTPRPRSFRTQKTTSRGRFALSAHSGNITSPPIHKIDVANNYPAKSQTQALEGVFSRLQIFDNIPVLKPNGRAAPKNRENVAPSTPTKPRPHNKRLVSPKKLAIIPQTPHRPSNDVFWSQEFVDDWNEKHSPRKLFSPEKKSDTVLERPLGSDGTVLASPWKLTSKNEAKALKQARKTFEEIKEETAIAFLESLDKEITNGKLAELSASTGGIKVIWSKTLNTTAGRANWKRSIVKKKGIGTSNELVVSHHYAYIELALKVITTKERLLNVLAHEFCHLANFMISGVTGNPHGKSFKAWAAKVTAKFGKSHGIEVTTRHSYEIDFRYIWECSECATPYRRHSKSIDPAKQRCGNCRGVLIQIKPIPRGAGKASSTVAAMGKSFINTEGFSDTSLSILQPPVRKAPTEYQIFMKEQMKIVKLENPGRPQKDIMKIVAERWSKMRAEQRKQGESVTSVPITKTKRAETPATSIGEVERVMIDLTLND